MFFLFVCDVIFVLDVAVSAGVYPGDGGGGGGDVFCCDYVCNVRGVGVVVAVSVLLLIMRIDAGCISLLLVLVCAMLLCLFFVAHCCWL